MKLNELKMLLETHRTKHFLLLLPTSNPVPVSFHITEVGLVTKKFIDCGGAVHSAQTCQLQAWVGDDEQHRLNAGKLADILKLARTVLPHDDMDVEVEYEDRLISQYTISKSAVRDDAVMLQLAAKHTDCLAKDKCMVPSVEANSCCGPSCC